MSRRVYLLGVGLALALLAGLGGPALQWTRARTCPLRLQP
jgi:hypothetical protein